MKRILQVLALAGCVALLATTVAADAATPGSGTISKTKKSVAWQGASVTLSSLPFDPAGIGDDCNLLGDPFCDHYKLRIDLGEGAKIQLQIKGDDPAMGTAKPYNDFDVFIYAPTGGAPIAEGTTDKGTETVTFVHRARFRGGQYDIAVRPWLVLPGASYKGSVKAITLGK